MNEHNVRLTDAEIEVVSGGWKECKNGTTAGGGSGLYPDYVECASNETLIEAFTRGFKEGGGTMGKPPA